MIVECDKELDYNVDDNAVKHGKVDIGSNDNKDDFGLFIFLIISVISAHNSFHMIFFPPAQ